MNIPSSAPPKAKVNAMALISMELIPPFCTDYERPGTVGIDSAYRRARLGIWTERPAPCRLGVSELKYSSRPVRLGFAWHGARKQKNRAAKHQRIRHVIKTIAEAGAFHYSDRHIDDQLHDEHGQANPRRRRAGFLANEQQGTRDRVNHGRQVRPNGVAVDVPGCHAFQRNAGNVIAVHELLDAEKQHRNSNEISRNRRKDAPAALAPLSGEGGCQRQSAAAEG